MAFHRSPGGSLVLLQPSLQLIGLRLAVADRLLRHLSHLRIFTVDQLSASDVDRCLLMGQHHACELDIIVEVLRVRFFMAIDANTLRRTRIVECTLEIRFDRRLGIPRMTASTVLFLRGAWQRDSLLVVADLALDLAIGDVSLVHEVDGSETRSPLRAWKNDHVSQLLTPLDVFVATAARVDCEGDLSVAGTAVLSRLDVEHRIAQDSAPGGRKDFGVAEFAAIPSCVFLVREGDVRYPHHSGLY